MQETHYLRNLLDTLPKKQVHQAINDLSNAEVEVILHDWDLWARDNQRTPSGDWSYWLILAGRGFGKTRTGAEWVRKQIKASSIVNLIGATADDARDVMIEGESGILAVCPKHERPAYKKSTRQLIWPNNAKSLIFTADEPERLRGKQHMGLWADELAAWRYPESWDQAMLGLRLGAKPQAVITTTPKPTQLVKALIADSKTFVTRGTTYDNRANLAESFFSQIIKKYEGTRLGRQELNAEILDDNPNALWKRNVIDELRVNSSPVTLKRVVVAVDPAVTSNKNSDETGIIIAAIGSDSHAYILDDRSLIESPDGWAKQAVKSYKEFQADIIIGETNNGGDLVEAVIRTVDKNVNYKKVHASRGKAKRAEPIAALYEQGRVHHVGMFAKLEDQMCNYDPLNTTDSPDRMDALVWALTELFDDTNMGLIDYYEQLTKKYEQETTENQQKM